MKPEDVDLIKIFFRYLKAKNKFLFSRFGKGLEMDSIDLLLKDLDIILPDYIKYFYTQKNGYKDDADLSIGQSLLFENGIFMSLEKCIGEHKTTFLYEPSLKRKFPLFDSGGGDFLIIDCDQSSKTYSQILIWSPPLGILEPVVIYVSFMKLLATTIRCLMVGGYYYNDDNELEINEDKQYEEAKRLNSYAPYWKEY